MNQYNLFIMLCIMHKNKGEDIKLNGSENVTELTDSILENELIVCSPIYEDSQQFIHCQIISNMYIPNNKSLDCCSQYLKIEFNMFTINSCQSDNNSKYKPEYKQHEAFGYLAQFTQNAELSRDANIVLFKEKQHKKKFCGLIKR
jgi:hypothetical protein